MTANKPMTYQEYLDSPVTLDRFDIVDGDLIWAPKPDLLHQSVLGDFSVMVRDFVEERKLGKVFYAPLDIIVSEAPLRVRQPDLMFISNENSVILRQYVHGGPDWIAEILRKNDNRSYIEGKLPDYARIGVRECWIASIEARTVEVLQLEADKWKRLCIKGIGETVESFVLTGFQASVDDIFRDAESWERRAVRKQQGGSGNGRTA